MRVTNHLLSALHFVVLAFLFFIGVFFFIASQNTHLYALWSQSQGQMLSFFFYASILCLLFSSMMGLCFYILYKKPLYQVVTTPHPTEIDMAVIQSLVESCFNEILQIPSTDLDVTLTRDQRIHIIVRLPSVQQNEHMLCLKQVEKKLSDVLREQIGYTKELLFTVSVY